MSRASFAAIPDAAPIAPSQPSPEIDAASGDQPDQAVVNRRSHRRLTLAEVPFVSKVRIKYGPAVKLIDLSPGGAQIETTNFRLQPGSTVVVEISSRDGELSIPAQVLRCQLASLLPDPVYRGSLIFKRPLDFKDLGADSIDHAANDLNPALEHARLRQLLKRLVIDAAGRTSPEDGVPPAIYEALGAALSTLETPAGRRSGLVLASELAGLFRTVSNAIGTAPTPAAVIAKIEDQLGHYVPARSIRLGDEGSRQQPGSEPVFFAIPSLDPSTARARIVVEFTEGCEPLESDFQLLKAGAQLIAIARELARLNGPDRPLTLRPEQRLPAGWSRIVIRYNNGNMLKGFTHNFVATKGFIHVSADPLASLDGRTAVPFTEVKAIFFVRDHEGNPGYAESKTLDPSIRGRNVSVIFADGEELVGTSVNYNSSAPGFFVHPADLESNNERVFIVAASVRAVKFL
jgi:Family of unknown function (DUF6982)/PilZ domain